MTITAAFFDVGGVLLSNGWDRIGRRNVVEGFELDYREFADRHDFLAHDFETGRIDLDEYLDRTVFYRERSFGRDEFVTAMRNETVELEGSLDVVRRLKSHGVFLATLNNESRDLNEYRIRTFGLNELFEVFLSSCYLGVKKPEAPIYKIALEITHRTPEEVVFVDDRPLNLECASDHGLHTIRFDSPDQLDRDLATIGLVS